LGSRLKKKLEKIVDGIEKLAYSYTMKNIMNKLKNLILANLTFNVDYIPECSNEDVQPDTVVTYKVIGHPSVWAWRTSNKRQVFTARVRNRNENYRCFGFDRITNVRLAWF
jgi:hypothetical protein